MSERPLLDLAVTPEVKQVKSFRSAAEGLTGEQLAEMMAAEKASAAAESEGPPKHFPDDHDGAIEGEPEPSAHEFAIALVNTCKEEEHRIELPADGAEVDLLDYHVLLTSLPKSRRKARLRPVHTASALGLTPEGRLAIVKCEMMPSKSTKGDTPLKLLLEGLALCGAVEAHRATLTEQIREGSEREVSPEPPILMVLANARYWELFRKRSSKTAGPWIVQVERLVREIQAACGIETHLLATRLYGDPGWRLRQGRPLLETAPRVVSGLETPPTQKKTRQKQRAVVVDEVVEADLDRPVRPYNVNEFFYPGDRIQHATLGEGVVQKMLGPTKVEVRFASETRVLVQGRGGAAEAAPAV